MKQTAKCIAPKCNGTARVSGKVGSLDWMFCTKCGCSWAAQDVAKRRK